MAKFRTASGIVDTTPYLRIAGSLVQCDEVVFYGAGGPVDSGTPTTPLVASASPNSVFGAVSRPGLGAVTTNATTVTVTGGTPPYTFAWSSDPNFSVAAPTSATTAFSAGVEAGDTISGEYTCLVTDSRGAFTTSNTVNVTASNYGRVLS